jgi:SAM-dependent methyltransferase
LVVLLGTAGVAAVAVALVRHTRGGGRGRKAPGGILVGDAGVYDVVSRLVLGPLFERIAADVAAAVPVGALVLEVGCGPGLLSIRLARRHCLDVTGVDLDPAMVERARTNTERLKSGGRRPTFFVGDVASLAFPEGSFDLVISTLSMHHWADPAAGLAEIGRVLRPGGRALVWDFPPGSRPHLFGPRHAQLPDPLEHAQGSPLRLVRVTPWRWPWKFNLTRRIELVRADGALKSDL